MTPEIQFMYGIIFDHMLRSEKIMRQAADQHYIAFTLQMRRKIGTEFINLNEPYLEYEIAINRLKYLEKLQFLAGKLEQQITKQSALYDYEFNVKNIDHSQPISPQVESRIQTETGRSVRHFKQKLDQRRQQAFGITKYFWRTQSDAKVRTTHSALDDQIIEWDNPPSIGHPGHDPNCRCFAEPAVEDLGEPVIQEANAAAAIAAASAGAAIISNFAAKIISDVVKPPEKPAVSTPASPDPDDEKPEDEPEEGEESRISDKEVNNIVDHSYEKHVVKQGEFPEIQSREDLRNHIESIIKKPDEVKKLINGRIAYWDKKSGTVVIRNLKYPSRGTVFRPPDGRRYFDNILR